MKIKTTICSTPGRISSKEKNSNLKICMHPIVHRNIIYGSKT